MTTSENQSKATPCKPTPASKQCLHNIFSSIFNSNVVTKKIEPPHEHLLRSLKMTATSRFIGARRLRSHEAWSLWAISLASLLLIFIPLFKPFGITVYLDDSIVNVAQILAAAIILVFSLLVNASKFGERAELMHSCALTINSISRRLEEEIHKDTTANTLSQLRTEYENLLEKHENHSDLDFLFAQIRRSPEFYRVTWRIRVWAKLQHWMSYILYIILVVGEALIIWLMLINPSYDPLRNLATQIYSTSAAPCATTHR